MEIFEEIGDNLRYLVVLPNDYYPERDYPLLILLHGFGANMRNLVPLAGSINQNGYIYVFPNAPMGFQMGTGESGFGWLPPVGMGREPEHVIRSTGLVENFFDEITEKFHTPPGKSALIGFSQGGEMTYRCGLNNPGRFSGLATLCSTNPTPEELIPLLPAVREQLIFIAEGFEDPMIAPERIQQTKIFLEDEGYHVFYKGYEMGHEISPEVLKDLVSWLNDFLPPLALQSI